MIFFFLINLIGIFYVIVAIIGFCLFSLISIIVYYSGVRGIKKMVHRFEMSMPNQHATCQHFVILTMLVFMVFIMTVSEILLYQQVNNNP